MLSISDPLRPGLISRRQMLRVGAFGTVGLSLPQLLRAESAGGASEKSCILIFANGGPAQLDTFDMKPDAPAEIRGEFKPIKTNIPGIEICELLPRLAKLADRFSLVRSVSHKLAGHMAATYLALTGHQPPTEAHPVPATPKSFPSVGAVLSKFFPSSGTLPSYVVEPQLGYDVNYVMVGQYAGFLGGGFDPLVAEGDPTQQDFKVRSLSLPEGIDAARVGRRRELVRGINGRLEHLGRSLAGRNLGSYQQRAFSLISSTAAKKAFRLNDEPEKVRDRYGRHRYGQSYLLARRLIESGVRMVMVNDAVGTTNDRWDNHNGTFQPMRKSLPETDSALASLLEDLDQRSLLDTTLVVWMGEMGREVKAPHGGHWPQCYTVLLAGGGIRGGRVYGTSDARAAYPADGACTPGDILATIYRTMGLKESTLIHDRENRPHHLFAGKPIRALL